MSLTAEGEVLLAEADAPATEACSQQTEPLGTVTLGFSPTVAELFGGRFAALSLRRYPG